MASSAPSDRQLSDLERLHYYCRYGNLEPAVELLKTRPELVKQKGELGNTGLHWASASGHYDLVQLLLEKHADPNAVNDVNDTPLHLAVWKDQLDCARLLLQYNADKNRRNKEGRSCAQMAISDEMRKLVPEVDATEIADSIQIADDD